MGPESSFSVEFMIIIAALDDVSGAMTSYTIEKLLDKGANNVHVVQTVTKKGRMGLLFFIDVDERHVEGVGEVVMSELGSIGYNVACTKHVHGTSRVSVHRVILRDNTGSVEEPVQIKRSFSPKGRLIRVEAEFDDLLRIVEEAKKRLGHDVTPRELKKKIEEDATMGRDETKLEPPDSEEG